MHFKGLPETITSEASWVRETLGPRHTAGLGGDLEMRVAMPIGLNKNKPYTNSKPQHPPHPTTHSLTIHTHSQHINPTTQHTTPLYNTIHTNLGCTKLFFLNTLPCLSPDPPWLPDMLTKLCPPRELLRAITDT